MKRTLKIISLSLAIISLLSVIGCGLFGPAYEGEPETFTKAGVEITLTDNFFEDEEEYYYDFFYYSMTAGVIGIKEAKSATLGTDKWTLAQYAEYMREMNAEVNPTALKTENGITYFEYSYEDEEDGAWTYYTTCFENGNYFWTIQFYSETAEYETHLPYFVDWAKTIKFVDAE